MTELDDSALKPVCCCNVMSKWAVTMIYRQSSALVNDPPWFHEIMVWEWNVELRCLGKLLGNVDGGTTLVSGMNKFRDICLALAEGKPPEEVME